MFKNSRVSLAGKLIITAIFVLTIFAPEILIMINLTQLGVGIGMSFVRLALGFGLYCAAMMGHGWARWITAFILIMALAVIVVASGRKDPFIAVAAAVIFIPSIAILLGLKTVQAQHRMHSRRHRSGS